MMGTKIRGVRVPDELWEEAQRTAARYGEPLSDAVRRFLIDYIGGNLPGYTAGFAAGSSTAYVAGYEEGRQDAFDSVAARLVSGKPALPVHTDDPLPGV